MANPLYRLDAAMFAALGASASQSTKGAAFAFMYPRFTITNLSRTKTLIGGIRPSWFAPSGPKWQKAINRRYGFTKWEGDRCLAVASDAFIANPNAVTSTEATTLLGFTSLFTGATNDDDVRDGDQLFVNYGLVGVTLSIAPGASVTVAAISKDELLTFYQEPFPRAVRIPRFLLDLQTADGDFMTGVAVEVSAQMVTEDANGTVTPSLLPILLPAVTLLPEGSKLLAYFCSLVRPFVSAENYTSYLAPWPCFVIPTTTSSGDADSPFSYEGPAVLWNGRTAGSVVANGTFQSYSDLAKNGLLPGQPVDDGIQGGGDSALVYVDRSFTDLTALRARLATTTGATVISDINIARQVCCGWNPGTTVNNTALWVTANFPGWRALEAYRTGMGTTTLISHTGASPVLPAHARILQRANNVLAIQFKPGDSYYDALAPTTPLVTPGYILVLPRV